MKTILITGGAGFVGSNIAIKLKRGSSKLNVIAFDNLKRRGSELNIPRLKKCGVDFIHGDIRNIEDLDSVQKFDVIIECSAEPSVLAGYNSSPDYLINTNLMGMINCLESARKHNADVIFLSTSRVYPIESINMIKTVETKTRFKLSNNQTIPGMSKKGISERFPLDGVRSLYGTSKLSAEYFLQEYISAYKIRGIINRCGVISGPWQMGKVDQGVVSLWAARHVFGGKLSYIGYGGTGKQVRDILHIDDVFNLINIQLKNIDKFNGKVFNAGGGQDISLSLLELTDICQRISNRKLNIGSIKETRPADIKTYITDNTKVTKQTGWKPKIKAEDIVTDVYKWIIDNKDALKDILC